MFIHQHVFVSLCIITLTFAEFFLIENNGTIVFKLQIYGEEEQREFPLFEISIYDPLQDQYEGEDYITAYAQHYSSKNLISPDWQEVLVQRVLDELNNFRISSLPIDNSLQVTEQVINYMKKEMNIFTHSQVNQDIWVINYFQYRRNGIFVDIGAHDGITFSNTYVLEKQLNWTGLLIEPHPRYLKSLFSHRQNSSIIPWCAYNRTEIMKFVEVSESELSISGVGGGADMLTGISETYTNSHHNWLNDLKKSFNTKVKERNLPCINVQEILDEYEIVHIDYLSIDTEGSELSILKAIDWDKVTIDVLHVELLSYEAKRLAYNFLSPKGYKVFNLKLDTAFYKYHNR